MRTTVKLLWLCVLLAQACDFADPDSGGGAATVGTGPQGTRSDAGVSSVADSGADTASPVIDDDDASFAGDLGTYPAGPYGFAIGDTVLDADFTDDDGHIVRLSELRARPGVKVIVWSSGAEWCGVCRIQSLKLQRLHTSRAKQGLLVVESLYQSVDGSAADAATLSRWRSELGATYVLLAEQDPSHAGQSSNPLELVIGAHSMKIRHRQQHVTGDLDAHVDAALKQAEP